MIFAQALRSGSHESTPYDVSFDRLIKLDGRPVGRLPMAYAGATSQFAGTFEVKVPGVYEATVYAYDPANGKLMLELEDAILHVGRLHRPDDLAVEPVRLDGAGAAHQALHRGAAGAVVTLDGATDWQAGTLQMSGTSSGGGTRRRDAASGGRLRRARARDGRSH